MNYFDKYSRRVSAYGGNESETFVELTKNLINQDFADAPSYRVAIMNNEEIEVRFLDGKDSQNKFLLFRPDFSCYRGDIIAVDGENWLIWDFQNETITPKASARLCNMILKWENNTIPCVVTTSVFGIDESKQNYIAPTGQINAYVQYNEMTKVVEEDYRFIFGNKVYKVIGVDDIEYVRNGKGYMNIILEITTKNDKDDFNNGVADNSQFYQDTQSNDTTINNWGRW
jgi:hypothetical protein